MVYYDPSGYSDQKDWLNNLPNMTYEERLEALYSRSDQLFQQKVNKGSIHYSSSGLLPGELDAVLGMNAVSGDGMSPHHMPSAHSIEGNAGIDKKYGACSNMKTDTHKDTFTYGMNSTTRPYDMALYESLSYEDRLAFDQYDLQRVYAETRPNVDMNVVESKLQEEYDMAMRIKEARGSIEMEGKNDVSKPEEMKDEGCQ